MNEERHRLETAIAALEAQRGTLGDAVVETLLAPARERLAALAARTEPESDAQSLRQVSILFIDVVGSTTLSRSLEPEDISEVMDDALARGTAIVRTHGGRVLQYAGDNILAAFGADEAREDDAERAVRCGLALLRLGRTLAGEVLRKHGHAGFDFRAGIHTGGVLLGGGVADGSIRGMAVNIAARMEQTAPPGTLRISAETESLVRGRFEVEPQPPLLVKGVDEPVRSVLVQRPAARAFHAGDRGLEGVVTRMVGRDAELQALEQALDRVQATGRLEVVTVVAEAGLGKSRLLREFERRLDARPRPPLRLRARCQPASPLQPYGLLRELLAGAWGLGDDDTLPQAQARVAEGVAPLFEPDEGAEAAQAKAHLLGHLLGVDHGASPHVAGIRRDVAQVRARAWHAATQWFRRRAAREGRPLLLLLEDLHWADDPSLDFLDHLAATDADVPLLLLATARPTLRERRPVWPAEGVPARALALAALDPQASQALVDELLQRLPEVPEALRQRLTGTAEGNPFYLEELVRMLVDRGAIVVEGDAWRIDAERLGGAQVPATLTGVLQARLDALAAAERMALQQASVIGPLFWDRVLAALDARAEAELPALVDKSLALPRAPEPAAEGLNAYAFSHHLLHQVTYQTVLRAPRRQWHGQVARWLAAHAGVRAGDFLALTADHFERAGEPAEAARWHLRAAEHARDRYAHVAVLHHVERGPALLEASGEADPALRWDLHFLRAHTLGVLTRRDEEAAALDALDGASGGVDLARQAYARLLRAESCGRRGDVAGMERHATEGRALAEQAGHAEHALRGRYLQTAALTLVGRLDEAEAQAREGLEVARRLGHPRLLPAFLNELSIIVGGRGDPVESLTLLREMMPFTKAAGDRLNEANGRVNLSGCEAALGAWDAALEQADLALRVAREVDSPIGVSGALAAQATAMLGLGRAEEALAVARVAASGAAGQGAAIELDVLCLLGHAALALDRPDEASGAFGRALALADERGSPVRHAAVAGLAEAALAAGDLPAALDQVRQLETVDADERDASNAPRQIEWTCCRVWERAGDAGRARHWLRCAHAGLQVQAASIGDEALRRDFLARVPVHAAIVAAWQAESG